MIVTIDDFDDPRLDAYARLTDLQLRNRLEPEKGIFIAEGKIVIAEAVKRGYEPLSLLMEAKWLPPMEAIIAEAAAAFGDVPVYTASPALISRIAGYEVTRGALGAFRRKPLPSPGELLGQVRSVAVLIGITNAMNVGAIVRNAAALGVGGLLIDRTTVDPLYRRALRSSMGTALALPIAHIDVNGGSSSAAEAILALLRDAGFTTIALALGDATIDLGTLHPEPEKPLAILLGAEGSGLPPALVARCDVAASIPMARSVDSLNVAAASAIAFWYLVTGLDPH